MLVDGSYSKSLAFGAEQSEESLQKNRNRKIKVREGIAGPSLTEVAEGTGRRTAFTAMERALHFCFAL